MCDFREPPKFIKNLHNNTVEPVAYGGVVNCGDIGTVKVPGMYYIAATGSHYKYFDGQKWWNDRNDWGPPSKEHWLPAGVYPSFNKYEFVWQVAQ